MGTVKLVQVNMCTYKESVHEHACMHTHSSALLTEKPQTHTPIHTGSHTELHTHTPTHTVSSPRPSVLPQLFLAYLGILSEPLQVPATPSLSLYLIHPPRDHPTHQGRGCFPEHLTRCGGSLLSFGLPYPTLSHSARQSQPFHGVSSVRSDSVFLPHRLLAACPAPGSCLFPFLLPSELWSFC